MSARILRVSGGGALRGSVQPAGDKSLTHRALLFAAMAHGRSVIRGGNAGDDCARMLRALHALGVSVDGSLPGEVVIEGRGTAAWRSPDDAIDLGNSGTAMRLLAGALAPLAQIEATLTGDASLRSRPMMRVVEPLRRMGARIDGVDDGRLAPLAVRGTPLRGIRFLSPVPSAQVKSAVLLAGLGADGTTSVVEPVASRDHTERLLKAMGAQLAFCDGQARLTPGKPLAPIEWEVPRDPSGAAFFLAAACAFPGSDVVAERVSLNATRIGFVNVLARMGARIEVRETETSLREAIGDIAAHGGSLHGTTIAAREIPSLVDEVPILAAIATLADGETRFEGVGELRVKESDRLAGIVAAIRAFGGDAAIEESESNARDGVAADAAARAASAAHPAGGDVALVVRGGARGRLRGARIESRGDHRIAMAFALLALAAQGESVIDGAEMIETSYPAFEKTLAALRAANA